jgi:hypothetical protein
LILPGLPFQYDFSRHKKVSNGFACSTQSNGLRIVVEKNAPSQAEQQPNSTPSRQLTMPAPGCDGDFSDGYRQISLK